MVLYYISLNSNQNIHKIIWNCVDNYGKIDLGESFMEDKCMGLNKWSIICLAAAAALAGGLCFPLHVHASQGSYTIGKTIILYSYDTNGDENEYKAISQHKKELENSGYDVILVDAGGFFKSDGNSVQILNTYGYDLAMPSGSDLLQGIDVFEKNMRICRSYLLCSNIKKNGRYLYKPRRIITSASGKKIGFIGILSVEDLPEGYSVLEGYELDKALQDDISALRQGGVDAIFLIGEGSERVHVVDDTIVEDAKIEVNSTTEKNTVEKNTTETDSDNIEKEILENELVEKNTAENENVENDNAEKNASVSKNHAIKENDTISDNSINDMKKSDLSTVSEDNSVSENNKKTTASLYEVMKGDSLWKISYKIYGKQLKNRWEEIFNLNKNKIANQEIIYSGQEFELPQ